jgi:DNA-binding beta-propeller fold protein YncE
VRVRTPEASLGPTAIAVGEGTAWIAWDDGSVLPVGVDGKARGTIDAGELASDIIVAGDFVWVADPFSGEVVRIDPRRDRVVGKIDVGGSPTALTSTEDHLWILDEAGVLVAVDLETRRQDVQIPVGEFPVDLDAGLGSVWVVNEDGTVRQISLTLMSQEKTYDVGAPIGTLDVDEERGAVWIRTLREGHG